MVDGLDVHVMSPARFLMWSMSLRIA